MTTFFAIWAFIAATMGFASKTGDSIKELLRPRPGKQGQALGEEDWNPGSWAHWRAIFFAVGTLAALIGAVGALGDAFGWWLE